MAPRDRNKMIEVDHYDEISKALLEIFRSNIVTEDWKFVVSALIGEISSGLRTLIANGYEAWAALDAYSKSVHRLHLDISILIENKANGKFEIVIFEIKKTKTIGLTELSQLIWYCLVSKCEFGVLVNVDNSISSEFSVILNADKDLTEITRVLGNQTLVHKFWVMVWDSQTQKFNYLDTKMAIKTLSWLVQTLETSLI